MFRPWASDNESGAEDCEVVDNGLKKSNKYLSTDAKQIVLNVYQYILQTEEESGAIQKCAIVTKVPHTTVWRIVKYGATKRDKRKDCGNLRVLSEKNHAQIIRQTIYDMYSEKRVITVKSLHQILTEKGIVNCSPSTITKFLKIIGFTYKKIDRRQVIMECERIVKWRYDYLKAINKYRGENRPIIYLDETWYDTHDVVKKGWVDDSKKCKLDVPVGRGKRIIILHAGSKDGWVHEDVLLLSAKDIKDCNVDYHEDMTADLFQTWFSDTLLPKLPLNSVVVLDNASYHSALINKIPNASSNKDTIMEFLRNNDLYYEESYTKSELLEVLKTRQYEKQYFIDDLAKKHGHIILRLPPYYCIFNPIEQIWAQLKKSIRRNNQFPKFSDKMVELIKSEVKKIDSNAWQNCIRHVEDIERSYSNVHVADLIINLDDSDNSSDEFDETL